MKKAFISQPMRGRDQVDILAERKQVSSYLIEQGYEVLDSMVTDHAPETNNLSLWYLGKSLEILATADVAYFCDNWEKNRGCLMEHHACVNYGVKIIKE